MNKIEKYLLENEPLLQRAIEVKNEDKLIYFTNLMKTDFYEKEKAKIRSFR